ncbi:bifunctional metallophosphatase/5'-nucleotidase [Breznakiella homolactica]|uniref:5'-nucleotidase C-terminal domain-containing protein n=1 Tax=Breznakiella homolactica TaxID=2798577 RepID=A0A7T8B9I0_9SPIR|nr:5'-nucleotidase C-terminal domain-containing protein [Breznakiella homolactica]QQO08346.1 5'-nucleotidase C-terminal domain-containing protein [Breznakiella homolactica]
MKRIKWLAPIAMVFLTLALVLGCSGSPKPVERDPGKIYELVLLHTNDHHGTVLPNGGLGGLAERATFIKSVRAENPQVLLVDVGDINTGSALSNMFSAEPDIKAYNMMGYDASIFGNHEFDGTQEKLDNQISMAEFPFICSNIKTKNGKYLGGTPYLVKNYDGIRVGLFGITTLRTQIIASPSKDLTFINELDAAREMVDILRNKEKVDIVIGLTHIGDVKEDASHVTSLEMAAAVPGIDIILDGHSHSYFDAPKVVGSTYVVSANEWGKFVGEGKLSVVDGKLMNFDWKPVAINSKDNVVYKPDAAVSALLAPYIIKAEESLKEVIGQAAETFEFGDRLSRKKEIALGDMICDANVWYFRNVYNQHIDFAFHNGGNIRAELPKGPITQENILTILPFENYLFIVSMKGSDIIELFSFIATIPQGAGGWPQMSKDVRYTIDYTSGTGQLRDLTINGAPVDPNKTYRFCTNDYLLSGGDGYTALLKAEDPFNTSLLLSYVVIEYIRAEGGTITPSTDGRIKIIGGMDL